MRLGVSYFGNKDIDCVHRHMEDIKGAGFDFVVFTYSENDHEYYEGTFDKIVKVAQGVGLEVYLDPWGVGGVFGGEAYSYLVMKNVHERQVSSSGKILPALCFNSTELRTYVQKWIQSAQKIGADGIFWDEPHFYHVDKGWACCCQICREEFRNRIGFEMPRQLTAEVRQFRIEMLLDFITYITKTSKEAGLKTMLCLMPGEDIDWDKVGRMTWIDVISTDPYWLWARGDYREYVRFWAKRIYKIAEKFNKEPLIWVQGFKVKKDEIDRIHETVKIANAVGIENFAVWSYKATKYMSSIACEDPDTTWQAILDAFKSLSSDR